MKDNVLTAITVAIWLIVGLTALPRRWFGGDPWSLRIDRELLSDLRFILDEESPVTNDLARTMQFFGKWHAGILTGSLRIIASMEDYQIEIEYLRLSDLLMEMVE